MATSSHDAGVHQHLALHSSPDNPHLYASLTPWSTRQDLSHTSDSPSAMFQRRGAPNHQLPVPNSQNYGPLDYVGLHPVQSPWSSSTHYRLDLDSSETLCSRATGQYGYALSDAPATQTIATCARPHPSSGGHHLPPALDAQPQHHIATSQDAHDRDFTSYARSSAPPAFLPNPSGLAPVARLLNYPLSNSGPLDVQTQDLLSQSPVGWSSRSGLLAEQSSPQTNSAASGPVSFANDLVALSSSSTLNGTTWAATGAVDAVTSILPGPERFSHVESGWPLVDHDSQYEMLAQNVSPTEQIYPFKVSPTSLTRTARGKESVKRPRIASSFAPRQPKTKVSKRKGPLTPAQREKAHKMRQLGSCVRCRIYKLSCDPNEICATCYNTRENSRVFHWGCSRDKITDVNIVRRCNGRFNQREADFLPYPWKRGKDIHEMLLIWHLPGFNTATKTPLRISVREYEPEGIAINSTESQWKNTNGELVRIKQPPYAVCDTRSLEVDIEAWFNENHPDFDQWILDRTRHDGVAALTFREALRMRNAQHSAPVYKLLTIVFRILDCSVKSQGYGSVMSANIPGIQRYDFRAMGHSVYEAYDRNSYDCPVPIAANHQVDVGFVKLLRRLEKIAKNLLHKIIFQGDSHTKIPWYPLFLSLFVLFWNMEYNHQSAESYIKSKTSTHVGKDVSRVVNLQIEEWDGSFDLIMHYWRVVIAPKNPFYWARKNPETLREHAGHMPDAESFQYMTRLSSLLEERRTSRFPPLSPGLSYGKWITDLLGAGGAWKCDLN